MAYSVRRNYRLSEKLIQQIHFVKQKHIFHLQNAK